MLIALHLRKSNFRSTRTQREKRKPDFSRVEVMALVQRCMSPSVPLGLLATTIVNRGQEGN